VGRALSRLDEPSYRNLDRPVGALLMERFRLFQKRDVIVSCLAAIADTDGNTFEDDVFRLGDPDYLAIPDLAMDTTSAAVIAGVIVRPASLL
jgi:hypothetical protein